MAELQSVDLGKARAEYLAAQARAELAKQTLERKRSIALERIVPQREVQEAKAASSSADAELRAATAALQTLGVSDDHPAPDHLVVEMLHPAGRQQVRHADALA